MKEIAKITKWLKEIPNNRKVIYEGDLNNFIADIFKLQRFTISFIENETEIKKIDCTYHGADEGITTDGSVNLETLYLLQGTFLLSKQETLKYFSSKKDNSLIYPYLEYTWNLNEGLSVKNHSYIIEKI